jgi:hypothetical protein
MSAPAPSKDASAKVSAAHDAHQAYVDLAERIFVQLSSRVYGTLASSEAKKPDPKALAAFSFKLADAFESASKETDRVKAVLEAANKAAVKLDDVDLSHVFQNTANK